MSDAETIGQMINITHHTLCRSWRNYKDVGDETNARQAYARAQGVEMAVEAAGLELEHPEIYLQACTRRAGAN